MRLTLAVFVAPLMVTASILSTFAVVAAPTASPKIDSVAEFRAAGGLAIQADMKSALPHLKAVHPQDLSAEQRATWACMRARYLEKQPMKIGQSVEPFTASVLQAYRNYWTRVMLGSAPAPEAERELATALAKLIEPAPGSHAVPDMDALEPLLQKQLEQRGYHALFGVTSPLREFMLWRKETQGEYTVDLPDGPQTVRVVFMDDFVSLGWLGYATCDYRHSAGWAKTDRLFAVRSAYDLDSESFHVSYLAHEGQHFSDYQRFPGMQQPDLEYRAKLVEIAKAKTTLLDLLADFAASGSDSRDQPHPWAGRQVVKNLAEKLLNGQAPSAEAWKRLPVEQINAAARDLLEQDSKRRAP